jgi:KaiC/GvpD/RAD55 family RecA-like ATPase
VIFLHAEGRGLWKRLRAYARAHHPSELWVDVIGRAQLFAIDRPINLSSESVINSLQLAIAKLQKTPALVVVDTMTRNSDGSIERSNEDATMYLNRVDREIRARYGCSVLLVHHVGHQGRDRARGPFALIASTDANFLVERPDLERRVITVRAGRMKDCEPPSAFQMEADVVMLDDVDDEDGKPETSLALRTLSEAPVTLRRPTGKAQAQLLAELERLTGEDTGVPIWTETELRAIGRSIGLHRNTSRDAVLGLRQLGYLTSTIGGSRLTHPPGPKGPNATEKTNSVRTRMTEMTEDPLGSGHSCSPSVADRAASETN